MANNNLCYVEWCAEFIPKADLGNVPDNTRGLYTLLKHRPRRKMYDVVYIGMARLGTRGVRARLRKHKQSKRKGSLWTHFSVFAVWPNILDEQVAELEGLLRHIYRKDTRANKLAVQKNFKKFSKVRRKGLTATELQT
jgi:hypothetical protein